MSTSDASKGAPRKAGDETYLGQKGASVGQGSRRAESHAGFFTPYLALGMRVLDCGCGPGSITCDLARLVAPGEVVGIDFNPKAVETATAFAAEQGVANAHFQTANVYELPFPDAAFDAVFSHALLDHLIEPAKAVREMRRVLRPGGLMGLRAPDFDGHIVAPTGSAGAEAFRLAKQWYLAHGESPCVGRDLRGLLHQAGCVRVIGSAAYECHGTPESIRDITGTLSKLVGPLARDGLIDAAGAAELVAGLQAWAEDPAAFVARPWCEAVGWVE